MIAESTVPMTSENLSTSANVRVRFAPSPTGYLHVGGARTALFNWLFARRAGGVFLLRIEDTDRERSSDEMTRAILEGMRWLGLEWDEGPFHQADGLERHRGDVLRLLEAGSAYRCFCTAEALTERRQAAGAGEAEAYSYDRSCLSLGRDASVERAAAGEPFAVRFQVPEGTTEWTDAVHGESGVRNEDVGDFVILRTDGTPTYNLAVVSDDIEMRISHVIRGDDHLSNTPKQILLYEALGATLPVFAHLPMILGPDGKRLSKRHGASAVGEYRDEGLLPTAMVNFLALLGWNPGDEREIMLPLELADSFSLERINRKSAVFDPDKLLWMNGRHLSLTPAEELLAEVVPALVEAGLLSEVIAAERHDWIRGIVDLLRTRAQTTHELADMARAYIADEIVYDEEAVAKHWRKEPAEVAERLSAILTALRKVDRWEAPALESCLRVTAERLGVGFGKVVHPLRLALLGSSASPGIDVVLAAFGSERATERIEAAIQRLRAESPARDH